MQITAKHQLYRLSVLAAVAVLTSVACNNSDYKTSDNSSQPDSIVGGANRSTTKDVAAQDSNAVQMAPRTSPATAVGPATAKTAPAKVAKRRFTSVTTPAAMAAGGSSAPQFPGGQKALDNYVNDHVNYPQDAVDNDVSGVVRVSFVVDEKGRITKAKLIGAQKVGDGL